MLCLQGSALRRLVGLLSMVAVSGWLGRANQLPSLVVSTSRPAMAPSTGLAALQRIFFEMIPIPGV